MPVNVLGKNDSQSFKRSIAVLEERLHRIDKMAIQHVQVIYRFSLVKESEKLSGELMHVMASFHEIDLPQKLQVVV